MKKNNVNKFSVIIPSIVQIVISSTCLIYNVVIDDNYWIWIIMLCSGVCILLSSISKIRKNE